MRRLIYSTLLGLCLTASAGCILPAYSPDPAMRTQELIFTAENLRALLFDWQRFWFLEMPDLQTPQRVHGGVI